MQVYANTIIFLAVWFLSYQSPVDVVGVQIISKSKLEKCEKTSDSDNLNCTMKIVVNMAVPSGSVILNHLSKHFVPLNFQWSLRFVILGWYTLSSTPFDIYF